MTSKRPQLLYRSEINGKILELTEKGGVYELKLDYSLHGDYGLPLSEHKSHAPARVVAIALVDPTYSNPIQQARRPG